MFSGKTVSFCITGGVSAYKAADIISWLKKNNATLQVAMTPSACRFITPLTISALSGAPVLTDLFADESLGPIPHIALGKCDLMLVAPATADILAKAACGIADDLLSAALLASHGPVLFAPAMNDHMYNNPATVDNIALLTKRGCHFVGPDEGLLACGDIGPGRLASFDKITEAVTSLLLPKRDFVGHTVLITAGPTHEAIDPVRYLANRSSGKMGYALAKAAKQRGAEVILVSGPVSIAAPAVDKLIQVESAAQMYDAVMEAFPAADIVIKAAAVADYRPQEAAEQKIKKTDALHLDLVKTPDILAELGAHKGDKILCGFAAETEKLWDHAMKKLAEKNLDILAANPVSGHNCAFAGDYNKISIFFADGGISELPRLTKQVAAHALLDAIASLDLFTKQQKEGCK